MGVSGEDLWMSPKAEEIYPFSVECKNVEKLNIWQAIAQAVHEAKKHGKIPLVAFTRNNEETYVTIPIDAFLEILARSRGNGNIVLQTDASALASKS
jgi:hypothetical protein